MHLLDSTCKGLVMQLRCERHTHTHTYLPEAMSVAAISTIHSQGTKKGRYKRNDENN